MGSEEVVCRRLILRRVPRRVFGHLLLLRPPVGPVAVYLGGGASRNTSRNLRRLALLDRRVRRRQACNGYAERGAAHVIQSNLVTEFDAPGIPAMLAANAALQ